MKEPLKSDPLSVPQNGTSGPVPGSAQQAQVQGSAFLGLSVDQLAGLSVDELKGNKVAITMLLHYYKQLGDENTGLKNERNTLSTYVDGYRQKKSDARIGAWLMALSNVFLGFGINLLTSEAPTRYGVAMALPGVVMLCIGLYFSLRDD
ncbi:MAG: hypothetical protein ACN6OP_09945 [Pseudomonadales bacterium]